MDSPLVFATSAYGYLQERLVAATGFAAGTLERYRFPDEERYQRIACDVAGRDVIVLGGTIDDSATVELYDLASGLVGEGVHRLSLIIPYFGYSTMERAVLSGEIVAAKNRARMLSSIPVAHSGSRVLLVDLHAEGIQHYFEGSVQPVHLYARPVILDAIRAFGDPDGDGGEFVVACTDAGRAKWVQSLANALGMPASFVFKRRTSGSETEITAVSAQVEGRRVVIYDDMIRTGGSLVSAARAYQGAGATSIAAVATHGVFPADALDRIRKSGLFAGVATTDTHPRALALAGGFLSVHSIAGLLAAHLTASR